MTNFIMCHSNNVYLILCFHPRGQHLSKFIGTKESVYIRKEFNSHRISLEHKYGRRFIVLGHKYGRHDVMQKHTLGFLVSGVIVTELHHQHLVLFQVLYPT